MNAMPVWWIPSLVLSIGSLWLAATAAGLRRELLELQDQQDADEDYALVSLFHRLTDDPVPLGLRLRFSRYLAAAMVPAGLALAGGAINPEWAWAGALLGWVAAAEAEALGGGGLFRKLGRVRHGAGYAVWARLTQPWARLLRPLLRPGAGRPLDDVPRLAMMAAETRAAVSGRGARLGREERLFLRRLLASTNILVADIMTPWSKVHTVSADQPVGPAAQDIHASGRSRHPVLEGDRVVGMVTAKDLLPAVHGSGGTDLVTAYMRPMYFVRQNLTAKALLEEMQEARVHLAVVVDKLGASVGIVTMEDVLEEIVGELYDEREREREDGSQA